ncbi:butyrophilin subfamily 1 member A1-like [Nothoprocta perdicaria]|uniref:butyrophilin subfamily 1 member A1-like n=1 Tax=Nothoprocta perdicaria TaxID=30464 RepID=UPI000E1B9509|nr:butyrophilin subfamily 1 member A1-like [Nothoprocta perdicaria]
MRKCSEEHRKDDGNWANITLDPATAHPRLVLSADRRSVRWEYGTGDAAAGSPCVLGSEAFTSGRHYWDVDVAQGQYCAVGVSRESPPYGSAGTGAFHPAEGIWAVQQWGFQNRALTRPPTALALPRVPRRIRVRLDCDWGEVAFRDADSGAPIFAFPPAAALAGQRLRPWFWLELGALALVR